MSNPPFILLDDQLAGTSRYYEDPVEIISASTVQDVHNALDKIQTRLKEGYHLAG